VADSCKRKQIDYTVGTNDSLWEFFKTAIFWRDDRVQTPVLIFDQFEEAFTIRNETFRRALAAELGQLTASRLPEHLRPIPSGLEAVEGSSNRRSSRSFTEKSPEMKILIGLREDYLGALQEFAPSVPGILLNQLRLIGLPEENVRHAIVNPGMLKSDEVLFSTEPFTYTDDVIGQMIAVARDTEEGSIDPFVLQLLCGHIEKKVHAQPPGRNVNGALSVDIGYLGGPEGILAIAKNFYLDSIKQLPQASLRRRARALCEEGLLTENGRRRSALGDDLVRTFKLSVDSLRMLEKMHLLRSEPRHGSRYYEISHDRIADVIHNNRRWRMPRGLKWVFGSVAAVPMGLLIWVLVNTSVIEFANRNYDANNLEVAVPLLWIAATVGQNAHAMNVLGAMYQNGRYFKINYSKAHKLLQRTADSGDRYAMDNLGWMYQNGQGVKAELRRSRALVREGRQNW
jgi:hypothetical protein